MRSPARSVRARCRTCRAWPRPAIPEVNIKLFSGYFAAIGTPPAIVAKIEAGLRKAITDPDVSVKLKALAVTPGGNSGADFRAMIDKDIESISAVIKAANLKFDN